MLRLRKSMVSWCKRSLYEYFCRNDFKVRYRALVVKTLHCNFTCGTLFIKDNGIKQDFTKDSISIHNNRYLVMTTMYESTLPVKLVVAAASQVFPSCLAPLTPCPPAGGRREAADQKLSRQPASNYAR